MARFSILLISLLLLVHSSQGIRERRFIKSAFSTVRQWLCRKFCAPPRPTGYIRNMLCVIKCPETYSPAQPAPRPTTPAPVPPPISSSLASPSQPLIPATYQMLPYQQFQQTPYYVPMPNGLSNIVPASSPFATPGMEPTIIIRPLTTSTLTTIVQPTWASLASTPKVGPSSVEPYLTGSPSTEEFSTGPAVMSAVKQNGRSKMSLPSLTFHMTIVPSMPSESTPTEITSPESSGSSISEQPSTTLSPTESSSTESTTRKTITLPTAPSDGP